MRALASGTVWTVVGYTVTQSLRFITNVVLARLLAPEILGIFIIVNTLRTGAELLSDIGTTQSVVQARGADDPGFYSTAWTMQIIRGALVFTVFLITAQPIAGYFEIPNLAEILIGSGVTFLIGGFTSLGPCMLQRRMELARLKTFEIIVAAAFTVFQVSIVYICPTVWSLVWGLLFGTAFRAIASFRIYQMSHRFLLIRAYVRQIFVFAKWVSLSSVLYFLTISFDRLYLAGAVSLQVLGVYGIARTIAEIVNLLVLSLGNSLVFPYIAENSNRDRAALRREVVQVRLWFLLIAAIGLSALVASADVAIKVLFDERYVAAGWMTAVLVSGGWFSLLCTLNETTLLGFGRSVYAAAGNGVKFVWLAGALPLTLSRYGIVEAVVAVALADACRYVPILAGQMREEFSFFLQDLAATLLLFLMVGCWLGLRWEF
jgi:O-antigen/teichoic acid export membrane protein